MMVSEEVVTPVEIGVQLHDKGLNSLASGACPGPDPRFAGMMQKGNFGPFTKPSNMISKA
jgi:hypothetical protein